MTPRLHLHIELAIANAGGDGGSGAGRLQLLEIAARKLGMTGAEIDMARQGRSFDIREDSALAVLRALLGRDPADIDRARRRARRNGIGAAELVAIETLAMRPPQRKAGPVS